MPKKLHFQKAISRFRQLEEMRKAINRVVMRFAAFYASKEMLYGNSS